MMLLTGQPGFIRIKLFPGINVVQAAITFQTPGTIDYSSNGGSTVDPTNPATVDANDLLVLIIGMKPGTANSGSVTTPDGWTSITSITGAGGYGTTLGADTGNTNLFTFYKVADGTEDGTTLSVSVTDNNVSWGIIYRFTNATGVWNVAGSTGSDTTAGNVSIAMSSDPGVTVGDYIIGAMNIPTDVTTPAQFSAEAFSQTGITFGAVTEDIEPDSNTGNDIGGFIVYATVSSGTSSGAPTMTATAGGTTTNVRGPGVFIRVRESPALPSFTQNDFRFYEDEATVSLTNLWGNFITGDNEDVTVIPAANNPPAPGEKIRLQINITVATANLSATNQAFKLQYKTGTDQDCSTGSWTDIGAKGGTTTAWRLYDNTSLADTTTEVNQISTSDVAGGYSELVTSGTNPNAVNIGQDMEWDWPIESYSSQVSDATTYSFRMIKSEGNVISYSAAGDCPTVETEPGTVNLIRHGQVFVGGVEKGFYWAN